MNRDIARARRPRVAAMTGDLTAQVLDWIDHRGEEMAGLLIRLVACQTENPPGRGLAECADLLRAEMGRAHHYANHGLVVEGDPLPVRLARSRTRKGQRERSGATRQAAPSPRYGRW